VAARHRDLHLHAEVEPEAVLKHAVRSGHARGAAHGHRPPGPGDGRAVGVHDAHDEGVRAGRPHRLIATRSLDGLGGRAHRAPDLDQGIARRAKADRGGKRQVERDERGICRAHAIRARKQPRERRDAGRVGGGTIVRAVERQQHAANWSSIGGRDAHTRAAERRAPRQPVVPRGRRELAAVLVQHDAA
jgi:hypothetical protein